MQRPESKKVQFFQSEIHDLRNSDKLACPYHEDDNCVFICLAISNDDRIDERLRLQRIRPAWIRVGEDLQEGTHRCQWLSDNVTMNTNPQIYGHLQTAVAEHNNICGVHPTSMSSYLGIEALLRANLAQHFDLAQDEGGQQNQELMRLLQQIAAGLGNQGQARDPTGPCAGNMDGYRPGDARAEAPFQRRAAQEVPPPAQAPAQNGFDGPPSGNNAARVWRRVEELSVRVGFVLNVGPADMQQE